MQRSGGQCGLQCNSQVKLVAHMCGFSDVFEIWLLRAVATWFWTPDIIPVQVRQAAGDVLAVQVIPERRREATCKPFRRITVKVRNASRRFAPHLAEAGDGAGYRPMVGDLV